MIPFVRSCDSCPTPRRLRAFSSVLVVPVVLALLAAAGAVLPSVSAAEEDAAKPAPEGNASSGSRSASTAWRFTKDGPKEIVVTPEQKARQAARKAKRAERRHAAEKAKAASQAAPDGGKPAAAGAAGNAKAVPDSVKAGAGAGADKVSGAEGAK
jgi:hypothetical protein